MASSHSETSPHQGKFVSVTQPKKEATVTDFADIAQQLTADAEKELLEGIRSASQATAFTLLYLLPGGTTTVVFEPCEPMGRDQVLAAHGIDFNNPHGMPWGAAYTDQEGRRCHTFGIDEGLKASAREWLKQHAPTLSPGTYEL